MLLLRRTPLVAAAAASAMVLRTPPRAESTTSPSAPSSRLRTMHEALVSGALGRRYTSASALSPSGLEWALSFVASDLRSNARVVQAQIVQLGAEISGVARTAATLPVDPTVRVSTCASHSLELRQCVFDDGKKLAVEVWSTEHGVRLARRVVDGVGTGAMAPGVFGTPQFSPSGSAVAWVGERLPAGAKADGYWPTGDKKDEKGGATSGDRKAAEAASAVVAGKYDLGDMRGSGELLLVHNSLLCVWDWRRDAIATLKAEELIPADDLPRGGVAVGSHIAFDGTDDGVIFACHLLPAHYPGLSACLNRPTRLYHKPRLWEGRERDEAASSTSKDSTGDGATSSSRATCLTPDLYFAHFPRLNDKADTLAFAARPDEFAGHSTVVELRTMAWPPRAAPPPSRVLIPAHGAPTADGFGGLCGFHDDLASLRWLDDVTLIFHTISAAAKMTYTVAADGSAPPTALHPPGDGGSVELLGVGGHVAIVQTSSLRDPPAVWACRFGDGRATWTKAAGAAESFERAREWWAPSEGAAATSAATSAAGDNRADANDSAERRLIDGGHAMLDALRSARLRRVKLPEADGGAEALVVIPSSASPSAPCAWVLMPHGGPHAASVDAFSPASALLVASGIGVVLPNYRGSLGYGRQFAEALLGRAGDMDVRDCTKLTRAALATCTDLDPTRGGCFGGSHGGFLTAWLLGDADARSLYRTGVLWNPVVDLPAMLGATDIPEWVHAEGLGAKLQWPLTGAQVSELHKRSPISVVGHVDVPTLMLLGAADRRVPHSQGRQWVAALQARAGGGPEVLALEFPAQGHAIASLDANAHAVQSAVAWLVERLASNDADATPTGGGGAPA